MTTSNASKNDAILAKKIANEAGCSYERALSILHGFKDPQGFNEKKQDLPPTIHLTQEKKLSREFSLLHSKKVLNHPANK